MHHLKSAQQPAQLMAIGGGFLDLQIEGSFFTGSATMTLTGDITGSYGCPGSMQSMTTVLTPTTSAAGSFSQQWPPSPVPTPAFARMGRPRPRRSRPQVSDRGSHTPRSLTWGQPV